MPLLEQTLLLHVQCPYIAQRVDFPKQPLALFLMITFDMLLVLISLQTSDYMLQATFCRLQATG